jgi:hypothetical protein
MNVNNKVKVIDKAGKHIMKKALSSRIHEVFVGNFINPTTFLMENERYVRLRMVKGITCYCCGSNDQLTRHHVVPRRVMRNFHASFRCYLFIRNVVMLCYSCHNAYEEISFKIKNSRQITDSTFWVDHLNNFVEKKYMSDYKERVDRGVALLNRHCPDWREKVTQELVMQSCHMCVLGQIFTDYDLGRHALSQDCLLNQDEAAAHGFTLPQLHAATDVEWKALGAEWKKRLENRNEERRPDQDQAQGTEGRVRGDNLDSPE